MLFEKELDKVYNKDAPEDDMKERAEEMERMREHVFKESDIDKNNLISFEEFLSETKVRNAYAYGTWRVVKIKLDFCQIYNLSLQNEKECR